MNNATLLRSSVALVWLYQGLWRKLMGRNALDQAVVAAVPFLNAAQARDAVLALGAIECAVGVWVVWGRWPRAGALAQTVLLAGMNAGGILWGSRFIPDVAGMLLQNFAFLLLAWTAANEGHPHDARA